jgi:tetratricopeptide (TPR) repeat protein
VDAYQKMMDQKPSPEAYSRVAHIRWLKGDLNGAMEAMQLAADACGSGAPESGAWFRTRLALYELQAGDFEKSSVLITAALTLQPNYPPALLARGRWLLAQGRPADAIEPLEHAAQLNPLPEYHWVLLEALQVAGYTQEIARVAGLLQQRGSANDPRTYALYLATRKQDNAIALQLAHDELNNRADVFTLDAVAWAEEAAGKITEARVYSKQALQEGTEDGRLFLHAAVIAQAAGDHEEATRLLVKANALQQMLLPSEKEILTALQNDKPIVASLQSH